MKAIHLNRLRKVVSAVESMPPPKFDMSQWFQGDLANAAEPGCGTAACAVGSYCVKNPRAGLRLVRKSGFFNEWTIAFDGETSGKAAEAYFGITGDEVDALFDIWSYANPSKENVIRRLRSFIARKERASAA